MRQARSAMSRLFLSEHSFHPNDQTRTAVGLDGYQEVETVAQRVCGGFVHVANWIPIFNTAPNYLSEKTMQSQNLPSNAH